METKKKEDETTEVGPNINTNDSTKAPKTKMNNSMNRKKKVTFSQVSQEFSDLTTAIPQKIKTNNSLLMDLSILLGILGVLFTFALSSGTNSATTKPIGNKSDRKEVKQVLAKNRKRFVTLPPKPIDYTKNDETCGLIIEKTSLPNVYEREGEHNFDEVLIDLDAAGYYGIFSIQNYTRGQTIFKVPLTSDLNYVDIEDNEEEVSKLFSGMLQSHPYLTNVELHIVDKKEVQIKATRDIMPGHELFLLRKDRDEKMLDKFSKINELVSEMASELIRRSPSITSNDKRYERLQASRRIIRSAVSKYDPEASLWLPLVKPNEYIEAKIDGVQYNSLKNRTHYTLRKYGTCFPSSLHTHKLIVVKNENGEDTVVATKDIKRGDFVYPILLHLQHSTQVPQAQSKNCWKHDGFDVLLCPNILHMPILNTLSTSSFFCDTDAQENKRKNNNINVAYKWSDWNAQNKNHHSLSQKSLLEKVARFEENRIITLSFDIYANRDIKAGEQISMDFNSFFIPDQLLPKSWRSDGELFSVG